MPRPCHVLPVALTAIAAAVAGCGGGHDGGSSGTTPTLKRGEAITMKSLKFHPDHVRVPIGQTIIWRNVESVPHDVAADSGASFRSDAFGKGKSFTFTPTKAGTITYECTLHPGMDGTIEVVAKGAKSTPATPGY